VGDLETNNEGTLVRVETTNGAVRVSKYYADRVSVSRLRARSRGHNQPSVAGINSR
jgi:hypothetical protein